MLQRFRRAVHVVICLDLLSGHSDEVIESQSITEIDVRFPVVLVGAHVNLIGILVVLAAVLFLLRWHRRKYLRPQLGGGRRRRLDITSSKGGRTPWRPVPPYLLTRHVLVTTKRHFRYWLFYRYVCLWS